MSLYLQYHSSDKWLGCNKQWMGLRFKLKPQKYHDLWLVLYQDLTQIYLQGELEDANELITAKLNEVLITTFSSSPKHL